MTLYPHLHWYFIAIGFVAIWLLRPMGTGYLIFVTVSMTWCSLAFADRIRDYKTERNYV